MITQEQKQFRGGKLGASDAGAALGVSPWESQAELWARISGLIPQKEETDVMAIGNAIEPFIADAYVKKTGLMVREHGKTVTHSDYDWLIAHPDYVKNDGSLVEIKNVGPRMWNRWGEDGDPEGAPLYVVAQCVVQAILTDVDSVDVCAYFGGDDLRVYPLRKITAVEKDFVLSKLVGFWDSFVVTGKQPPFTSEDLDLIKRLYPSHKPGKSIDCPENIRSLLPVLREAKASSKVIDERIKAIEASIKEAMGDAESLKNGDVVEFTWKQSKDRKKTDWYELAGEFSPSNELIGKYTETKPGARVFLDKYKKEKS